MARTRRIIHTSSEVTQLQNAAGYRSPLFVIRTPEGAHYRFENPFQMILKLYDSGGNQIPATSRLYLYKKRPGEDLEIGVRMISYAGYADLSEAQQRDTRYREVTLHDLGSAISQISNPEDHELQVWIDSPVAVELSQAATRFEVVAIEEN